MKKWFGVSMVGSYCASQFGCSAPHSSSHLDILRWFESVELVEQFEHGSLDL
jgi:hypothetical protein